MTALGLTCAAKGCKIPYATASHRTAEARIRRALCAPPGSRISGSPWPPGCGAVAWAGHSISQKRPLRFGRFRRLGQRLPGVLTTPCSRQGGTDSNIGYGTATPTAASWSNRHAGSREWISSVPVKAIGRRGQIKRIRRCRDRNTSLGAYRQADRNESDTLRIRVKGSACLEAYILRSKQGKRKLEA
jgi:hypothetical protein